MSKVHSHYENLKVARDAPLEVIRAAYRSLSQKYHPDRNAGDPNATRIMAILNRAYEVLSDPEKRRAHDLWIAKAEAEGAESTREGAAKRHTAFEIDEERLRQSSAASPTPAYRLGERLGRFLSDPDMSVAAKAGHVLAHVLRNWIPYGIAAIVVVALLDTNPNAPRPGPKPYVAAPAPATTAKAYVRASTAPNGELWPASSGYVNGYKRQNLGGLSSVTIDNSQNSSDVFVKLVSLDGPNAFPVRHFYIGAHDSFTVKQVKAGSYDVRYRDLESGRLSRSEAFRLEETQIPDGTRYSNMTLTLYKVRNGNMKTFDLGENEF